MYRARERIGVSWPRDESASFPTRWKSDEICTESVPIVSSHPVRPATACGDYSRACGSVPAAAPSAGGDLPRQRPLRRRPGAALARHPRPPCPWVVASPRPGGPALAARQPSAAPGGRRPGGWLRSVSSISR